MTNHIDNHNLRSLIKEVLDKGYLISLGTSDENGMWVADVIYVHDNELNIYWISHPNTRHSQAIQKDHRVAGTITLTQKPGDPDISLQISGVARKVEADMLPLAIKHRQKRNKPIPNTAKEVLDDDAWYVLQPTKIELTYEPRFGWEKQVLILR